jgi:DNA-binding PadR family transcriptional regulator
MPETSNLPLTETTTLILLSLAPGPSHGYAIMKDVHTLSEERVALSTGTLYGALNRLLEQGWIERVDDPQPNSTRRERKAYRLSAVGRSILIEELDRLESLNTIARQRLSPGGYGDTQQP